MQHARESLTAFYGPIALPPRDLFAFFVWDVLSTRTLAARRDRAWQALKRLPALTPDAMFRAPKDELKAALEPLGAVDDRMEALRDGAGHLRRHRNLADLVTSSVWAAARVLREVPHLSKASRVTGLVFVGRHPVPAADAGIVRVVTRVLGSTGRGVHDDRRRARRWLTAECGRDVDRLATALVVLGHHAHHACAEQAPHCVVCPLRLRCAHGAQSVTRVSADEAGPAARVDPPIS